MSTHPSHRLNPPFDPWNADTVQLRQRIHELTAERDELRRALELVDSYWATCVSLGQSEPPQEIWRQARASLERTGGKAP